MKTKRWERAALGLLVLSTVSGCASTFVPHNYQLSQTSEILVTSEAGETISARPNVAFVAGKPDGVVLEVKPSETRQTLLGVGTSFTESAAFVLAHLEPDVRREVMRNIYGDEGANFSLARTHIASTDFSVEGKYAYVSIPDDTSLDTFSIAPDREGFSPASYPGIVDSTYDLLPMIEEALAVKSGQQSSDLRIVASAWTAPPWMKDIDTWFIKGAPENNWQGTGGSLKPEHVGTYADYLVKYLDAYKAEGIDIWGLTPVNEPNGNGGQWESMHFTPETQNEFVKRHLGPRLHAAGYVDTKLLIYDQNRDHLEEWTDVLFADEETAQYIYGAAVHWYSSTEEVYEDTFERVNDFYPEMALIHTEGTIDDLGKPAFGGIGDPEGFRESNWFQNDAFWWNVNATDWAYTAEWAPNSQDHPMYTPVHRYARDIIVGFNHWLQGWIDWNIVLDAQGGPNHVGNFCGAPIMIDTDTGDVYYTPVYHVLAQLSRTIRPGDVAVKTDLQRGALDRDALHASASVNDDGLLSVQLLNTTKSPIDVSLSIGKQYANVSMAGNALYTVRVQLP